MLAARIFARQRSGGDGAADDDLAAEIHPVVPGEIERHVLFGDAGLVELGLPLLQRLLRPLQHVRPAADADLVPHEDRKSFAGGKSVSVSVDFGGRRIIKKNEEGNAFCARRSNESTKKLGGAT